MSNKKKKNSPFKSKSLADLGELLEGLDLPVVEEEVVEAASQEADSTPAVAAEAAPAASAGSLDLFNEGLLLQRQRDAERNRAEEEEEGRKGVVRFSTNWQRPPALKYSSAYLPMGIDPRKD